MVILRFLPAEMKRLKQAKGEAFLADERQKEEAAINPPAAAN